MKGRPVAGYVRRILYEGRQAMKIVVKGNHKILNIAFNEILVPNHDYWSAAQVGLDAVTVQPPCYYFKILKSTRYALSGWDSGGQDDFLLSETDSCNKLTWILPSVKDNKIGICNNNHYNTTNVKLPNINNK